MTVKTKTKPKAKSKTVYEATFVLSQEGLTGDVVSKLKFSPLIDGDNDAPPAYEIMAYLVQEYLHLTGMIDDNGDLTDPDAFHATASLDVSDIRRGKLN